MPEKVDSDESIEDDDERRSGASDGAAPSVRANDRPSGRIRRTSMVDEDPWSPAFRKSSAVGLVRILLKRHGVPMPGGHGVRFPQLRVGRQGNDSVTNCLRWHESPGIRAYVVLALLGMDSYTCAKVFGQKKMPLKLVKEFLPLWDEWFCQRSRELEERAQHLANRGRERLKAGVDRTAMILRRLARRPEAGAKTMIAALTHLALECKEEGANFRASVILDCGWPKAANELVINLFIQRCQTISDGHVGGKFPPIDELWLRIEKRKWPTLAQQRVFALLYHRRSGSEQRGRFQPVQGHLQGDGRGPGQVRWDRASTVLAGEDQVSDLGSVMKFMHQCCSNLGICQPPLHRPVTGAGSAAEEYLNAIYRLLEHACRVPELQETAIRVTRGLRRLPCMTGAADKKLSEEYHNLVSELPVGFNLYVGCATPSLEVCLSHLSDPVARARLRSIHLLADLIADQFLDLLRVRESKKDAAGFTWDILQWAAGHTRSCQGKAGQQRIREIIATEFAPSDQHAVQYELSSDSNVAFRRAAAAHYAKFEKGPRPGGAFRELLTRLPGCQVPGSSCAQPRGMRLDPQQCAVCLLTLRAPILKFEKRDEQDT